MRDSPEATLRKFFRALTIRDAATLKAVCMPHEHLEVLWAGGPARPKRLRNQRLFDEGDITSLKVGHVLKLQTDGAFVMDDSFINEDRRQLTMYPDPFPFDIVRLEGQWRVERLGVYRRTKRAVAGHGRKSQGRIKRKLVTPQSHSLTPMASLAVGRDKSRRTR